MGDDFRHAFDGELIVDNFAGEQVPFEYIAAVFGVMAACPQHTFQVLTKRAEGMREFFAWASRLPSASGKTWRDGAPVIGYLGEHAKRWTSGACNVWLHGALPAWPLHNVWLGVSVEDQATADARIPALLHCPAAVRWVSYEPALGPVEFAPVLPPPLATRPPVKVARGASTEGIARARALQAAAIRQLAGPRIDWIVIGGESGPGSRPFDVAWARDTIAACKKAVVPVFTKQLGAWPTEDRYSEALEQWEDPAPPLMLRHPKGGDMAEWPADLRVREMPEVSS